MQQLLPLQLENTDFQPVSFVVTEANELAHSYIQLWPKWPSNALLLSGAKGSGKTHLAHLWAEKLPAPYKVVHLGGEALPQIVTITESVVIEWPKLSGARVDEVYLFHLLNHTKSRDIPVLIESRVPASQLRVELPDLASRLNAMPTVAIHEPDEILMHALLVKLAGDRQLYLPPEVVLYLVTRMERSFEAIGEMIALLDETSMAQRRSITVPFVRELLG